MVKVILEIKDKFLVQTPKGEALTLFLINEYTLENTIWICSLLKTGEIKHFNSEQIKLSPNYTFNINVPTRS